MGTCGRLYIVATPIGNLGDMTYRAVDVLKSVDTIACEDTRQTRKLLDHYGISTRMVSYHDHNEADRTADLLRRLSDGQSVALVSDAGTPLVADPGYRVVHAAVEAGIPVVAIPGACAAIAGLSVSGLPSDSFRFAGFFPRKESARKGLLESHAGSGVTLIAYEAPHRILEALEAIETVLGDVPVVAARELTKMHEEVLRGTAREIREALGARDSVRGEFTVLVGPVDRLPETRQKSVRELVAALEAGGMSRMQAIKEAARAQGIPKREAYRKLEEGED